MACPLWQGRIGCAAARSKAKGVAKSVTTRCASALGPTAASVSIGAPADGRHRIVSHVLQRNAKEGQQEGWEGCLVS